MSGSGEAILGTRVDCRVPTFFFSQRSCVPFKASSRPRIAAHSRSDVVQGRHVGFGSEGFQPSSFLYLKVPRASFSPIQAKIGNQVQRCPTSPQAATNASRDPDMQCTQGPHAHGRCDRPKACHPAPPSLNAQRRGGARPSNGHLIDARELDMRFTGLQDLSRRLVSCAACQDWCPTAKVPSSAIGRIAATKTKLEAARKEGYTRWCLFTYILALEGYSSFLFDFHPYTRTQYSHVVRVL